jgi:hypothetical protein
MVYENHARFLHYRYANHISFHVQREENVANTSRGNQCLEIYNGQYLFTIKTIKKKIAASAGGWAENVTFMSNFYIKN